MPIVTIISAYCYNIIYATFNRNTITTVLGGTERHQTALHMFINVVTIRLATRPRYTS